ncbi:MAG: quinolinate synthase NadA [Anaerovoracaceae bacterium]
MKDLKQEIIKLKKEKDIAILAHYYVPNEIQDIADYVGDSYYLSKIGTELKQDTICFCGVSFMGESAKILNPTKNIIMPDLSANCPMAHMASIDKIKELRKQYKDLAVVCYINSTAELKSYADVCVTSSNAKKIVEKLPNKNIFFIPDENLGRYIASIVDGKNFIFNDGFCHVHAQITAEHVNTAKSQHPNAKVLTHPECREEVTSLSDYVGSTSGIIDFATASDCTEFIVSTELGVLYELEQKNPNKSFYPVSEHMICPDMKLNTLEKVLDCIKNNTNQVNVDKNLIGTSLKPLNAMLELAK